MCIIYIYNKYIIVMKSSLRKSISNRHWYFPINLVKQVKSISHIYNRHWCFPLNLLQQEESISHKIDGNKLKFIRIHIQATSINTGYFDEPMHVQLIAENLYIVLLPKPSVGHLNSIFFSCSRRRLS